MVEAIGELATRIYSLVEAVKVDGKLRKGANEATKSVERGEAKLVVIASDVNPLEVVMHLPLLCKEKNISFVHIPAKTELGAAAGLPVGTSAVAIALAGDAKRKLDEVLADLKALEKKAEKPKEEIKKEEKPIEKPAEKPKEIKKPEEAKKPEIKKEEKSETKEKKGKEAKPKDTLKKEPAEKLESKVPAKKETSKAEETKK